MGLGRPPAAVTASGWSALPIGRHGPRQGPRRWWEAVPEVGSSAVALIGPTASPTPAAAPGPLRGPGAHIYSCAFECRSFSRGMIVRTVRIAAVG